MYVWMDVHQYVCIYFDSEWNLILDTTWNIFLPCFALSSQLRELTLNLLLSLCPSSHFAQKSLSHLHSHRNRIQKKNNNTVTYLYLTSFGECLTYATINTQKYWRTLPNLFLTPREVTPISPLSTTIGYRQSSWTGFVSLRSGNEHTDQPQHSLVEKQLFTTSGSGGVFFRSSRVFVSCISVQTTWHEGARFSCWFELFLGTKYSTFVECLVQRWLPFDVEVGRFARIATSIGFSPKRCLTQRARYSEGFVCVHCLHF